MARAQVSVDQVRALETLRALRTEAIATHHLEARVTVDAVECRLLADVDAREALRVADAGLAAAADGGGPVREAAQWLRACRTGLLIERGESPASGWRQSFDALAAIQAAADARRQQAQADAAVQLRRAWAVTLILLAGLVGLAASVALPRLRQARHQRTLASTDPLTGLANRRAFLAYAGQELTRAQGSAGKLSVLMIDVDSFKAIKDTHGPAVGDEVLRHVALVLGATLRERDKVGRFSGEEFITVLPNAGLGDAIRVAERMRTTLAAAPAISDEAGYIRFTISIGVAEATGAMTLDTVVADAAAALGRARQAGRNCVCATGNVDDASAGFAPADPVASAHALPPG